jgi:hypothetical protein
MLSRPAPFASASPRSASWRSSRSLAFSSIDDYTFDDDGHVSLAVGAPPRAMQSIKRRVQETGWDKDGHVLRTFDVEIKLWDKTSMLHLAARHVGIGRDQPRGADDLVPVSKLSDATLAAVIADLAGRVH